MKNGKRTKKDEKSLITHQIGENWELLLRQADQDNGENKGKYISLYQKLCHLFKNRLNNFVETPFKCRWRGTERWNFNIYESPLSRETKRIPREMKSELFSQQTHGGQNFRRDTLKPLLSSIFYPFDLRVFYQEL